MRALETLYAWRDTTARDEDESTRFVLPNQMMFKIAEQMPRTQPCSIMQEGNPSPPPPPPFRAGEGGVRAAAGCRWLGRSLPSSSNCLAAVVAARYRGHRGPVRLLWEGRSSAREGDGRRYRCGAQAEQRRGTSIITSLVCPRLPRCRVVVVVAVLADHSIRLYCFVLLLCGYLAARARFSSLHHTSLQYNAKRPRRQRRNNRRRPCPREH